MTIRNPLKRLQQFEEWDGIAVVNTEKNLFCVTLSWDNQSQDECNEVADWIDEVLTQDTTDLLDFFGFNVQHQFNKE
jgi:hypothetical protein